MILECPECHTRYAVPDQAIGVDGRMVRCISCKHEWFEKGDLVEEATPEPKEESDDELLDIEIEDFGIPEGSALPSLTEAGASRHWMFGTLALALMLLTLTGMHYRQSLHSLMPGLYEAMGYYPAKGLVLAKLQIKPLASRRTKRFALNCTIVNHGDSPQPHPPLAMRIVTSGGNILAEDDAYLPAQDHMIAPGEAVDCGNLELSHRFASADKLLLEIGSPWDLGKRGKWSESHSITEPAIVIEPAS
jgi:predicted Zn finger-like uncharacterized protein